MTTGSDSGLIKGGNGRVFDLKIGSVSVLVSGTTTSTVMCIGLWN